MPDPKPHRVVKVPNPTFEADEWDLPAGLKLRRVWSLKLDPEDRIVRHEGSPFNSHQLVDGDESYYLVPEMFKVLMKMVVSKPNGE